MLFMSRIPHAIKISNDVQFDLNQSPVVPKPVLSPYNVFSDDEGVFNSGCARCCRYGPRFLDILFTITKNFTGDVARQLGRFIAFLHTLAHKNIQPMWLPF